MRKSFKYRQLLHDVRRVVVKIGTKVIMTNAGRPDIGRMRKLIADIAWLQKSGKEVIVITSGAIGTGMEILKMKKRPTALPDLQMAAAVGQCRLIARYDHIFSNLGCKIGQVLLTHTDFTHKLTLTNAKRTIENMIRNGVIPVINENDVLADDEIKADMSLGDNDYLSSLVVKLVRADLLIMLSVVDGILAPAANGKPQRIKYIEEITRSTYELIKDKKSQFSKGGMTSKLKAAESVSSIGCTVVIANGKKNSVLRSILSGDDAGTMILGSV